MNWLGGWVPLIVGLVVVGWVDVPFMPANSLPTAFRRF